jgi:DNA repair protein RadD
MLRPYQVRLKSAISNAWAAGNRNVLAVLPTGGGKTVIVGDIVRENSGASVLMAHRSELVTQLSLALARNQIYHRVIAPPLVARTCTQMHLADGCQNFVHPKSKCAVSSVQTLVRHDPVDAWTKEVTLWVCDESHHLTDNMWRKAIDLFPNARGLGPTATPCRADGKGLGAHADGVMDVMVVGPTMRDLINDGWLSEYRIFAPPSDIDVSHIPVSASGDFSPKPLAAAVHASRTIVGDIVQHYIRVSNGKLGITFTVDIEAATEVAAAYRAAGVPAEVITGKTPAHLRISLMRRFRNREILQLVNVDVLGEGVDVPAVEVVSDGAHTMSYSRYAQRFGRMLRLSDGKTHGIYIDHVGNTARHGLPDAPRKWTLDRRERRSRETPDDAIPIRVCAKCLSAYERIKIACPYCGERPVPATRSSPEAVDGDLHEMSPELLARLRGESEAIDRAPAIPYGATPEIIGALKKRHRERGEAQIKLRETMALWGGMRHAAGDSVSEQQRRFFYQFGIDVLSAQGLNRADSESLTERIKKYIDGQSNSC